jgi:hypothetical protein
MVVLTTDRYNPGKALVAPLRERAAPELAPVFLVPLSSQDWSTSAVIDLSRARRLDPSAVAGQAGQLTASSLSTLSVAVRSYLGAAT